MNANYKQSGPGLDSQGRIHNATTQRLVAKKRRWHYNQIENP